MTEKCPATREAVIEQEEQGEVGCPLCGRWAGAHPSEDEDENDYGYSGVNFAGGHANWDLGP